jgi:hypothetical protein
VSRAAALAALSLVSIGSSAMNIDSYWEYSDPAASEARFRAALPQATADERLELLTQIARTQSLRRQFAEAHSVLDDVERQLDGAGPGPHARYLLERGAREEVVLALDVLQHREELPLLAAVLVDDAIHRLGGA